MLALGRKALLCFPGPKSPWRWAEGILSTFHILKVTLYSYSCICLPAACRKPFFGRDRTPVISVKYLSGASLPQAGKAQAWAVLSGLAVKKPFLCAPLADLSFDLKWLLAAVSTAFTTAGTIWASAKPVCAVEWCALSADLARVIFLKEKKGLNLLPLLLLEHLCFVGQSPRRSCQESCSLRSVQRSSQGGVDAHPALHGSSVVYFLTSFWRKTSFNDSGFSPFLEGRGFGFVFSNWWWKNDTSESRWRRWRGLSILLLHSTDCCWKSSLSLIIFFLCSQFLTMLITKTFLF